MSSSMLLAALFSCPHCDKHALRESVPADVGDSPMPPSCWISCPWCGRSPMGLAAPTIAYPATQSPPGAWAFVRFGAGRLRAVQTAEVLA